jgi:hypothetical protein
MTAAAFFSVAVDAVGITMRDFVRPASTSVISCPLELHIMKIEHVSKTTRFLVIILTVLSGYFFVLPSSC